MGSQRDGHSWAHTQPSSYWCRRGYKVLYLVGTLLLPHMYFYSGSSKLYSCSSPPNLHFFVGIFLLDSYCFWKPFHLFSGLEFQLSSNFAKSNFSVYISLFPYCFWMISIKRRQKCQLWKQERSSLNLNTFLSLFFFFFFTLVFSLHSSFFNFLFHIEV